MLETVSPDGRKGEIGSAAEFDPAAVPCGGEPASEPMAGYARAV